MNQQSNNRAIGQSRSRPSFREMAVWQEAQAFALSIATLLPDLPRNRSADVVADQLMRAAGSIPANIAEGYGRFSQAAYRSHLSIARGSAFECESWLDLLIAAGHLSEEHGGEMPASCSRVQQFISTRMKGLGDANQTYARGGRTRGGSEEESS